MRGTLLYAISRELIAQGVVKMVKIDRNFGTSNPPQSVLPATMVGILDSSPDIFVGGLNRPEYTVGISVSLLDYDIDIYHTSEALAQTQQEQYNIPDRIERIFNSQVFITDDMKSLVRNNNLITRSRGSNHVIEPFGSSSKNVITYDINIRAILSLPLGMTDNTPIENYTITATT